tara:strand:- start:388 stop:1053 length:666 start_codon:yes stop_codon:yes gene_type:complete
MRLLSTKKLNKKMKMALIKNNYSVVEMPMIKTVKINFIWPEILDAIIITSSFALKSIIKHPGFKSLKKYPFFCVGSRTKEKLLELGIKIEACEKSAKNLAIKIGNNYRKKSFNYFCGKQRLKTIENFALANNIKINISEVYQTNEIHKKINEKFDGIIFFSPSAVRGYASLNTFDSLKVFSWGNTTTKEITRYCDTCFTSKSPSTESLILLINKTLKKFNA